MSSSYLNTIKLDSESKKLLVSSEVEQRGKKLELGWLGIVFGSKENCAQNIAGFAAILCLILGSIITGLLLWKKDPNALASWEKFSTVAALALGYLFGIKSGNK